MTLSATGSEEASRPPPPQKLARSGRSASRPLTSLLSSPAATGCSAKARAPGPCGVLERAHVEPSGTHGSKSQLSQHHLHVLGQGAGTVSLPVPQFVKWESYLADIFEKEPANRCERSCLAGGGNFLFLRCPHLFPSFPPPPL